MAALQAMIETVAKTIWARTRRFAIPRNGGQTKSASSSASSGTPVVAVA